MGIRAYETNASKPISFGNFRLFTDMGETTIRLKSKAVAWPVTASKLDKVGLLKSIQFSGNEVQLSSAADEDQVKRLLTGHRKSRKLRLRYLLVPVIPAVVTASLVPLGPAQNVATEHLSLAKQECSDELITKWLEGNDQKASHLNLISTTVLGGVTSGTLQCKDSRYSYTLGSKEPKRVLNLKRLDS
jgi:hypothetical protein